VKPRLAPLALLAALCLLAGCGGGEPKAKIRTATCSGAPLAAVAGLPADFPRPEAVVFLRRQLRGPTTVVDGYWEGDLEEAFRGYSEALEQAGYAILDDEREAADAEVVYEDPAGETGGQVALRDHCREDGRVVVHITARPT